MNWFKEYCKDFPGQGASVVVALTLISATGVVVLVRLAAGKIFPDGYGEWLLLLGGLSGVTTIGMIGKRATDFRYKQAGTSPVNVEAPSTVTVTQEAKTPTDTGVL